MNTALITGITGQDGSYLSEFLLDNCNPPQHVITSCHGGLLFVKV